MAPSPSWRRRPQSKMPAACSGSAARATTPQANVPASPVSAATVAHVRAVFAATSKTYGSRSVSAALKAQGIVLGPPSVTHAHARGGISGALGTQIHPHHRQQSWPTGSQEHPEAPLQTQASEHGVGKRDQLRPHSFCMAVLGGGAGLAIQTMQENIAIIQRVHQRVQKKLGHDIALTLIHAHHLDAGRCRSQRA